MKGKSRAEQCMRTDSEIGKRRRHESAVSLRIRTRNEIVNTRRMQPLVDGNGVSSPLLALEDTELFEKLPQVCSALGGEDRSSVAVALRCVQKLLMSDTVSNDKMVEAGICVLLVHCTQGDPSTSTEAASCLGILSEDEKYSSHLLGIGCVQSLLPMLQRSPSEAEQALWTLASLGSVAITAREVMLQSDVLKYLCNVISLHPPQPILRNAVWLLSSLTTVPQYAGCILENTLDLLSGLLYETDEEILVDCCWCLANLTDYGPAEISKVSCHAGHKITKRLADLLSSALVPTIAPILRVFGNMASGPVADVDYLISLDVLPMMCYLLAHQKKATRREVCWALSNIMAGPKQHIQQCIEANLIPPLVLSLQVYEAEVKKEAVWAVCNCTKFATPHQINYLVLHGVVVPLIDLLRSRDKQLLLIVLEGMRYILEANMVTGNKLEGLQQVPSLIIENGGIELLEALLEGQTDLINAAATSIIETLEKGDDGVGIAEVVPAMSGQFQF